MDLHFSLWDLLMVTIALSVLEVLAGIWIALIVTAVVLIAIAWALARYMSD